MSCPDPTPAWLARAEEGLFAVAIELRRLPLSPRTRHLHLRALALKRELKSASAPGELLEDIRALRDEVRRERERIGGNKLAAWMVPPPKEEHHVPVGQNA